MKSVLLESGGLRLSEIIRLMIAVDSIPLAKVIARVQPAVAIPPGVEDMNLAEGSRVDVVGAVACNGSQVAAVGNYPGRRQGVSSMVDFDPKPVSGAKCPDCWLLFDWLALIEDEMMPRVFKNISEAPPLLNIPHLRDVRDEIRMSVFPSLA